MHAVKVKRYFGLKEMHLGDIGTPGVSYIGCVVSMCVVTVVKLFLLL